MDYQGNAITWVTSIPTIDDLTPPQGMFYNPALEGLADRTAFLYARMIDGENGQTVNPTNPLAFHADKFQLIDPTTGDVIFGYYGFVQGLTDNVLIANSYTPGTGNFSSIIASSLALTDNNGQGTGISYRHSILSLGEAQTVDVSKETFIFATLGTLTAGTAITITVANTNAGGHRVPSGGCRVRIVCTAAPYTINIVREDGTLIAQVPTGSGTSTVECEYIGHWIPVLCSQNVTPGALS